MPHIEEYSPDWDTPAALKERRRSSLSRRNSSVWLASAAMDSQGPSRAVSRCPSGWNLTGLTPLTPLTPVIPHKKKRSLDSLPQEILTIILQYVVSSDTGPADLCRLLATCGRIYDLGVAMLYRHVVFRTPHAFDKFRWSIEGTGYGQHVRVFDFSAFTSVGLGRTKRMNSEIQMVTASTIRRALDLCSQLVEFLAAESIDTDLDAAVLDQLLTMPVLQTLDFCGATAPQFIEQLHGSLVMQQDFSFYTLTKLSLHCCNTIPAETLTAFLSKCPNLTRLDVTHTQLTDEALHAVPPTVQLTHLSLSRCVRVSNHGMVRFLVLHPACKKLKWLNLMFEATKPNPLGHRDIDTILRFLPKGMTYLNIYGQKVTDDLLQLIDTSKLRSLWLGYTQVTMKGLEHFLPSCRSLKFVNLSGIPSISTWTLKSQEFQNLSSTVDMFEFSPETLDKLAKMRGFFVFQGRGRRCWLFRSKDKVLEREQSQHNLRQTSFSFGQVALDRINARNQARRPMVQVQQTEKPPPSWDPIWRYASVKVNVSLIGLGNVSSPAIYGNEGFYNYYAYHNI